MSQSQALQIAETLQANEFYVHNFGDKGGLGPVPSRGLAVITCMDARLDPAAILGLKEGDAHVIRNAGGRAVDALRSLIISQQLLETNEVIVLQHTHCGMLTFDDVHLRRKLIDGAAPEHRAAITPVVEDFSFLAFSDLENSVRSDVAYLKAHPLIQGKTITGAIYDVTTGAVKTIT